MSSNKITFRTQIKELFMFKYKLPPFEDSASSFMLLLDDSIRLSIYERFFNCPKNTVIDSEFIIQEITDVLARRYKGLFCIQNPKVPLPLDLIGDSIADSAETERDQIGDPVTESSETVHDYDNNILQEFPVYPLHTPLYMYIAEHLRVYINNLGDEAYYITRNYEFYRFDEVLSSLNLTQERLLTLKYFVLTLIINMKEYTVTFNRCLPALDEDLIQKSTRQFLNSFEKEQLELELLLSTVS